MLVRRCTALGAVCLLLGCTPRSQQDPASAAAAKNAGARRSPAPAGDKAPPKPAGVPTEAAKLSTDDGAKLVGAWRPALGKPVAGMVLVPMISGTHADYEGFSRAMSDQNVTCLAISLRGQGDSQAPGGKSREQFASEDWRAATADIGAAVAAVREKLGDKPVVLVGASIGANLAIHFAAQHPDLVQGLVLLSPGLDYHGITIADAFGQLKEKPVMVVCADDDIQSTPAGAKLQTLHDPVKWTLTQYPGREHGTDLLAKHDDLAPKVGMWLARLR